LLKLVATEAKSSANRISAPFETASSLQPGMILLIEAN